MDIVLECPHCKDSFIINEKDLNCMIIRHAAFKHNMEPINPHMSKNECENLIKTNSVIGCAKPAKIIKKQNEKSEPEYIAIECDYI